jgi:hypothetical protein
MPVASAAAGRIIVASAGLGFVVVVSLLVMFIITASVSGAHSDAVMCGVMLGMWMLAGWCVSRAAFRAAAGEAEEEDKEGSMPPRYSEGEGGAGVGVGGVGAVGWEPRTPPSPEPGEPERGRHRYEELAPLLGAVSARAGAGMGVWGAEPEPEPERPASAPVGIRGGRALGGGGDDGDDGS